MPAIDKLKIKGFKAFPIDFELKFEGKHLLLYGENGSGKSSIYFALHCLFQSPLKNDAGKKYFNQTDEYGNKNDQHLLNLNVLDDSAKVSLSFDNNHPFVYEIDKNGYNTMLIDNVRPLPADINGVFINHKFLFHFFSFRNSEQINLFPVFEKDILPYFNCTSGKCLSVLFEDLKYVPKKGNRVNKDYYLKIRYFNEQLLKLIEGINLRASDVYNDYLKEDNDKKLLIKLYYPELNDIPDKLLNGYWLKYDYLKFISLENGKKEEKRNTYRSHNKPFIRLEVCEILEDGFHRIIPKPQAYFNEAKLTAIALSVRFALLNLDAPMDGRFLALDDMLISLDMSNRTKVIDFLLEISDKFKIYLFTHDRAFFELAKREISTKSANLGQNKSDFWIFKELYHETDPIGNPKKIRSETSLAKAKEHFRNFDYPAAANYLRKEVEELMTKLPDKIQRKDCGDKHEKLRSTLDNALALFKRTEGAISLIQILINSLDTLLNPLSHRSTDTNIFKVELNKVFETIPSLYKVINDMSFKECIPRNTNVYLLYAEDKSVSQQIRIKLTQDMYSYTIGNEKRLSQTHGESLDFTTITDGENSAPEKLECWKDSLENICLRLSEDKRYKMTYSGRYLDYLSCDTKPLSDLIK